MLPTTTFVIAFCAVVIASAVSASAQRLTGNYIVIDSSVVGRVDDASGVATRTFRYNDTVRAIRRVDDTIIVTYRDLGYRLPISSVVKEREFKRYRRFMAVASDSAEVRTDQSTIWVRKGAVLMYLGDDAEGLARVRIYGLPATVRRSDVIMLQSDPNAASTIDDEPQEEQRPFRVRTGIAFGGAIPLSDDEYLDGGFSWGVNLDVRVASNNFFLTAGYTGSTFSFEDWTGIIGTGTIGMLHAGVIVGLTSEPSTVVPYTQLALRLFTDDGDAMLIGGFGTDFYFTPQAVAFAEVMPVFSIDAGEFFWLPIRLGLKYGF